MRIPPEIQEYAQQEGVQWGGYFLTRKAAVEAMVTRVRPYRPSSSGAFTPMLAVEVGGIGSSRSLPQFQAETFWAVKDGTVPPQMVVVYPAKRRI